MNDKGNRYALSALKDKRSALAGEVQQLQRQIDYRKQALAHLDATIQLMDPDCDIDSLPLKRPYKRTMLFKQGELGRLILDALRKAENNTLPSTDIVRAVMDAVSAPESAWPTMAPRVKTSLTYLRQKGSVEPLEKVGGVRVWRLITDDIS
jgi:hypothetical protein